MCKRCEAGPPQDHFGSRRDFLKATAAASAAVGWSLFAAAPVNAQGAAVPADTGKAGRRYVIRGGAVLSMDPAVGDFPQADVLV